MTLNVINSYTIQLKLPEDEKLQVFNNLRLMSYSLDEGLCFISFMFIHV
jgi:hypothetical protein